MRAVNAAADGVSGGGTGPASPASDAVAPRAATLSASSVTHNSATLTIANYSGSWYYKYITTCLESTVATTTIQNLAGNTSYTFKAYSDSSCTSANELASETFLTTPAQPSKPSVSIGSGKLTISSSVSGGSGDLSKWQYTTDDGTNWTDISTTSTTLSHTVTGLTDGTNYTFKVRAVNSAGSGVSGGGTSPESAASAATAPQTATLAATNNVTATTAILTITDYSGNWYYKRTAPSAGTCVAVTGVGTPDASLTDLSPGTSYTFKAYSDNTCDTELTSDATDADFLTRPGQVSGVTVIASNRSLSVSWTAPSGTVSGYTVQWKSGSGEYDTTNQATSTGTSYTISGLTNDTQYTLRVAAKNTTGDGAWSTDATGTPTTNVTLTPSDVTDTSLKLTITNHSGTWYYKYTSPGGDTSCTAVSSATAIVTGLAANTSYTYAAYSDSGCSTELATATAVKTLPAQVTGVEVVPRDASLSVTWDRPRPGSGSPNYEVQWKSGNEDWDRTNRQNTAQNYFTQIPSLSNAVEYTVRVRRITTSPRAVGEWSELVRGTPAEVALTTRSVGATTATLVIANYANSAGDVWYYKRTAPTASDQPYGICSDGLTTGNTTVVLTGLSSGTRYTFKAYRDSTCTTELAEVSFTPSTPSTPTPSPSPEISASAVTATTATLTIANYSGSWYYKRTAPADDGPPYGTCSAATGTSVELTGLSASTSYSFTAYSDSGCTTELATATLSTPAPGVALTTSNATATSLKLTIANHSGSWYYKHTIPSDGQCSSAVSSSTAVASGLQNSTSYIFKAYSDSGCTTVLATAAATSTLAPAVTLTAGDATATSLKLTIANHSGNWYYKYTTPSGGQCSSAVSGTTAVASGLQNSTSYIFKAYNDSGCNTVLATAAAINTLAPGAPAVTLTASDATATSLKLTIANHSGSWYYKYTTTSGGQCSNVASGTTAVASDLQSSTSYTFKAYSDSGCNTVLATTAAINTLAPGAPAVTLTAGDATATSLKLAIANHSGSWYYKYTTPGGGQCSGVVSGTTVVASGLQSSTSYIFKAYSDSGCTTVLATAAATSTNKDPATQAAQKKVNQVAQEVTPEVNRVVSATTANAVTQRVSQVVQGTLPLAGTQISWGNLPNTAEGAMELARRWAVDGETISVAALLDNSSFTTSFPSQSQATATEMGDGNAPSFPWGVWGAVDYGQIASGAEQGTTEWDAGVLTTLLGADRMVNDRLLAGAALAWSSSSFDYQTNGSASQGAGKGEGSIELFTINPYLGWRLDDDKSLWASVGYGWGDLTIDDEDDAATSTELTQWSLAAGASGVFYQSSQHSTAAESEAAATNQLVWKSDAWFSSLQAADKDLLEENQAYRLRLGVEGNRTIPLANQVLLTPSLGLFYRYDGGDGTTGSGLDLAAALRYDTPNGLRLEGRGRTLLLHSEGLRDWGISGLVRYSPSGDDGFSISLSPKWGRTDTNDLQQLWSNHQGQFFTTGEVASALLLDAELRSPKLAMGSYVLTPALGFQFSPDAWTTRLGTALQLHSSLNLQLDLSRQQPEEGGTNHSLGLNLEMEF